METETKIFGEQPFLKWLLNCEYARSEKQANEFVDSLKTSNDRLWLKIGENLKRSSIDFKEAPVACNFDPFLWIKQCYLQKDEKLLLDVVTLYSSILRRLLEKVNFDIDRFEAEQAHGIHRRLEFSDIQLGNYSWSDAVRVAYNKFERSLPLPSRTVVSKWYSAWSLYVNFLNFIGSFFMGIGCDLNGPMRMVKEHYKEFLDLYGVDSDDYGTDRTGEKQIRARVERYLKNLEQLGDLKSIPIDEAEKRAWLENEGKVYEYYLLECADENEEDEEEDNELIKTYKTYLRMDYIRNVFFKRNIISLDEQGIEL